MDGFWLAPQLLLAHVLDDELGRHLASGQQSLRYEHAALQRATARLDTGGGIDGVTAVDDVLLDIPDLGGDDEAAVQAGLEFRHAAVARQVAILLGMDLLADQKDASKTVALTEPPLARPGHDRFVADVLVDLAASLEHGLGDVVEEIVLEVVEAQRPQLRGD